MDNEISNLILTELQWLRGDMSILKKDIVEVKERLTNVEGRLTSVEEGLAENNKKLNSVQELAEFNKENIESIKNVVTSHYMEFKKYANTNATQHNLYNAKLLEYKKEK